MSNIGVDWESRVDWNRIRAARVQSAVRAMKEEGIGAIIVQRIENLRFLTCMRPFTSLIIYPRYAAVIFDTGHVCLLAEEGDYEFAKRNMPWIEDLRIWPYDREKNISILLELFGDRGFGKGRLGYDNVTSPSVLFGLGEKMRGVELVDATETLSLARLIKDPEEIKVIRGAAQVAEVGMLAGVETLTEGVRESDIAAEMVRAMIAAGADALVTFPQVSTDALRRMASDARVRHGDVVLLDINIGYNGYVGDFGRTFAVGEPTSEQRRIFQVQRDCLETAISMVKPGTEPKTIQNAVRDIVAKAGLEKHWLDYVTGHGLGVGMGPIEQPYIGSKMGPIRELREGMVIAFEPGIFDPAVGPIRNEEMVLVTSDGHERLSRFKYCEKLSHR